MNDDLRFIVDLCIVGVLWEGVIKPLQQRVAKKVARFLDDVLPEDNVVDDVLEIIHDEPD